MAHPVFLSYSWSDLGVADALDRQLQLHAVPVWRDRRDMHRGSYMADAVKSAIQSECSGFELLVSPNSLPPGSGFIHEVELPAMDERARRDPGFFTGATFLDIDLKTAGDRLSNTAGG